MPRIYKNPHGFQIDPPEFRVVQRKPMPEAVLTLGLCKKIGKRFTDLAYSEDPADIQRAVRVCERCPVRLACCHIAIENHERYGVWGGMTEGQREREFASPYSRTGALPIACSYCGRPFLRRPGASATVCHRQYCDFARGLERIGLL